MTPDEIHAGSAGPDQVLLSTIEQIPMSSLSVHVDFLDLVDRQDEPQAWETLGKLKDLLA